MLNKVILLTTIASTVLFSCATNRVITTRDEIDISNYLENARYNIHVVYFNQNDIGETESIYEIKAIVASGNARDNKTYYQWIEYKTRSYTTSYVTEDLHITDEEWTPYIPATGFTYIVDGFFVDDNELFKMPNLDSIPRTMEGFRFYINIIDFHTWEIYKKMFIDVLDLKKIGDRAKYDMNGKVINIMSWDNLTSDFVMEDGYTIAENIGSFFDRNGNIGSIVHFEQNQKLKQFVYGQVGPFSLKMPYWGTTRFIGNYFFDSNYSLERGYYYEYVYGKVKAPMFITVIVHTKRYYSIEKEDS